MSPSCVHCVVQVVSLPPLAPARHTNYLSPERCVLLINNMPPRSYKKKKKEERKEKNSEEKKSSKGHPTSSTTLKPSVRFMPLTQITDTQALSQLGVSHSSSPPWSNLTVLMWFIRTTGAGGGGGLGAWIMPTKTLSAFFPLERPQTVHIFTMQNITFITR